MLILRKYQEEVAEQGLAILSKYKIVYLVMEVRTGKTLTALKTADLYGAKKVLFITKKRAIDSRTILNDYEALSPGFEMQLINKESLHKITDNDFDLVISDEHHATASAYPKANKSAKDLKKLEKTENLPEDLVKDKQDEIQKLTDKFVRIIDTSVDEKETEVLTV